MSRQPLPAIVKVPLLIGILLTLWVWQRITVVKTVHANDKLKIEVAARQETARKLTAGINDLKQRSRIAGIATEHLGLVPSRPAQRQYIPEYRQDDQIDEDNNWNRLNISLRRLSAVTAADGP